MKVEEAFDVYWEKEHKGDERLSGDFSYDEIIDFTKYLRRKDMNFSIIITIIASISSLIIGVLI